LLSACVSIKEEGYQPNAEGWYILKDMSESQLKKLAEEFDIDFDELLRKKEEGFKFKDSTYITRTGEDAKLK
jgi:arsenate reductase-like glutaredoxin family protein